MVETHSNLTSRTYRQNLIHAQYELSSRYWARRMLAILLHKSQESPKRCSRQIHKGMWPHCTMTTGEIGRKKGNMRMWFYYAITSVVCLHTDEHNSCNLMIFQYSVAVISRIDAVKPLPSGNRYFFAVLTAPHCLAWLFSTNYISAFEPSHKIWVHASLKLFFHVLKHRLWNCWPLKSRNTNWIC